MSNVVKILNDLCVKYRTYVVEFNVEHVSLALLFRYINFSFIVIKIYAENAQLFVCQGAVMLPLMFAHDFGDQIDRYAMLADPNYNKFEVLVERHNGGI